jgi:arginase
VIDIIGAPFDLCGKRIGTRLGPAALRLAGLVPALIELGCEVSDVGDLPFNDAKLQGTGIRCFKEANAAIDDVRQAVQRSLRGGHTPLVLGGDHSISIGSVGAALDVCGDDMAVLWMDAHADLNTPGTTPSGNMHGMPVAALLGHASKTDGEMDRQWHKLLPKRSLKPEMLAYFGIRDLDHDEKESLRGLQGVYTATTYEIDRHGIVSCLQRFDRWMCSNGAKGLWISFDVDMLDPFLAPGTGTAARGGLTYRESHLAAELLREYLDMPQCPYKLVGLDVVEANPLVDTHNETSVAAVEWIASLFGKTILGKR